MHSAWVPPHTASCVISSSFGQTWKGNTYFTKLPTQTLLTLDFNTPLGHKQNVFGEIRLGVHCQTRHDSMKCEMENASMFPLAERRRRQKFTLVLFLSSHPAVSPGMPSACYRTAQWHWANDVIISSHFSVGPLDPWACAEDKLVMMCGVQLRSWQNTLMPRRLRMPKCCTKTFEKSSWLTFELLDEHSCYLCVFVCADRPARKVKL